MRNDESSPAAEEIAWPVRPIALAGALIRVSTMALPDRRLRARYRQEFAADLAQMQPRQQITYSLRVLRRAWSLRRATSTPIRPAPLREPLAGETTDKPVLCALNLHHHWDWQRTDDGQRYRRCRSCGKDDDGLLNSRRHDGSYILGVGPSQ